MNIIETIIWEKKYLHTLHDKKITLHNTKERTKEEEHLMEKELNQVKKKQYELSMLIKHYNNVNKIIRFNTILKFVISLIFTIIVIKFVPSIYANLWQNLILIPFYFGMAYTWVKNVNKELEFKNSFDIVLKKIEADNLTSKVKRLEAKLPTFQTKLNTLNKELNSIKNEEEIHTIYFNKLKDILENYYLNSLTSYLGEDLVKDIQYPKLDLQLKKF